MFLDLILTKTGYKPKRILFVDDRIENLGSLKTAFLDVEFIGLHYPLVVNRQNSVADM